MVGKPTNKKQKQTNYQLVFTNGDNSHSHFKFRKCLLYHTYFSLSFSSNRDKLESANFYMRLPLLYYFIILLKLYTSLSDKKLLLSV